MRDNRNIEELSDQAWAKMSELLDHEMPVQDASRKKPVFWWFWSAAIVLLGIMTIAILALPPRQDQEWVDRQQPTQDKSQAPAGVVADASTDTQITSLAATLDDSSNESASATTTKLHAAGLGNMKSATSDPTATAPALFLSPTPTAPDLFATENILNPEEITMNPVPDATIHGPEKEAEQAVPSEEDRLKKMFLEKIVSLPLNSLAHADLPLARMNVYNPKKSLFVPLELQLGLISREARNLNGALVELRSGLKLGGSENWSLQTGLGIHHQRRPFTVSYQQNIEEAEVEQSTGQNGNLDQGGNNTNVVAQIASSGIQLRSTYWYVPLLLHWQFSPRWSVEAGGQLNWRLSASWVNDETKSNSLSGNQPGAAFFDVYGRQASFYLSSSSRPTTFALNDLYGAGTAGIAFRPASNLRLRLQYQHSISNLLDNQVYKTIDRSIRLSAGLQF